MAANAEDGRESNLLVVDAPSSEKPRNISIRHPDNQELLLEFVDLVQLREPNEDGAVTVRYGRIDVARFKAVLNGKDLSARFAPKEGKRERVRLELAPGINKLTVEVAPADGKRAEVSRATVVMRVRSHGLGVTMTGQGRSDDTQAKRRLESLMQRIRAGDRDAGTQLQSELNSLDAAD